MNNIEKMIKEKAISKLESIISNRLGIEIKFKTNIKTRRDGIQYLELESQEIVKHSGIFSHVFNSVKLGTFGSEESKDKTYYWLTIDFWYHQHEGGSNGSKLLSAHYFYKTKEWNIKFVN